MISQYVAMWLFWIVDVVMLFLTLYLFIKLYSFTRIFDLDIVKIDARLKLIEKKLKIKTNIKLGV